ncbi:hypothetical protein [Sphingomonas crocodyli]|nr:hypothetical protein [Sphingomonas crocodyli]
MKRRLVDHLGSDLAFDKGVCRSGAMNQYEVYCAQAETQRRAAAQATLVNRREMHLRAAATWEAMAEAAKDNVERAMVNEAAKMAGPAVS